MIRFLTSLAAVAAFWGPPAVAEAADMEPAQIVEAADVTVALDGLVCDFCATAVRKVFGKRDEVVATHVDLDTKQLSIVLTEGAELDDATLAKLVEKAGYKMAGVSRQAG